MSVSSSDWNLLRICSTVSDWYSIGGGSIISGLLAAASFAPGVKSGLAAGVLTGEGALGAGVSTFPNENPDFAAGVVVAGTGVVAVESFAAGAPKLNPPAAAGLAASVGLGAAAPPNEKPPNYSCIGVAFMS